MAFLTKKWERENGYRLRKELFAFTDNKVCFPHVLRIPNPSPIAGCIATEERENGLIAMLDRSQSSSGTNGTTSQDSGGGPTGSKIGRLRRMGG